MTQLRPDSYTQISLLNFFARKIAAGFNRGAKTNLECASATQVSPPAFLPLRLGRPSGMIASNFFRYFGGETERDQGQNYFFRGFHADGFFEVKIIARKVRCA
jgi:hypothetical protein